MFKNGAKTVEEGSVHPPTSFTTNIRMQPCALALKFNILMAAAIPWWITMSLEKTANPSKSHKMLKNGPKTIEEGSVHPPTTFTAYI